jgi:hypothetical protein
MGTMNDELDALTRRWIAADRAEEDSAEELFRAVLGAVPRHEPPQGFSRRVGRTVRRIRWQRRAATGLARAAGLIVTLFASLVMLYVAVVYLGPLAVRSVVRGMEITLSAVLWIVLAVQSGFDTWAVLIEAGRTLMRALATTQFTTTLVGVEIVAALALYALYRMLSQEKESVR